MNIIANYFNIEIEEKIFVKLIWLAQLFRCKDT